MYLDRLMETGEGLDWGICGVGVLRAGRRDARRDARRRTACSPSWCGTRTARSSPGSSARCSSTSTAPTTRRPCTSGSTTPPCGSSASPSPRAATSRTPPPATSTPRTPPSCTTSRTPRTRAPPSPTSSRGCAGGATPAPRPFTVMSCDNLQGNGDYARQAVVGFARLTDAELADVDRHLGLLPQLHGRPHHPLDDGCRPRGRAPRVRHRGRVAGAGRALHPVDRRGRVPHRQTGAGVRRACSSSTTCGPTS